MTDTPRHDPRGLLLGGAPLRAEFRKLPDGSFASVTVPLTTTQRHPGLDPGSSLPSKPPQLSPEFVPGHWRCAKCNFRLITSTLNAADSTVTARDEPGEHCPNDGQPLWRMTWRELATEQADRAVEAAERYHRELQSHKAAITHLRAIAQETVAKYGRPGGPWNVPSDPGGWLDRMRAAIAAASFYADPAPESEPTPKPQSPTALPITWQLHGEIEVLHLGQIPVGRVNPRDNGWIFNLAGVTAFWKREKTVALARGNLTAALYDWARRAAMLPGDGA